MFKNILCAFLFVFGVMPAIAQGASPAAVSKQLGGLYACTLDGKKFVTVNISDQLPAGKGKVKTMPGKIGVAWGNEKPSWGDVTSYVAKQAQITVNKSMITVSKTREPKDDVDALQPYAEIVRGGKTYKCGAEAG